MYHSLKKRQKLFVFLKTKIVRLTGYLNSYTGLNLNNTKFKRIRYRSWLKHFYHHKQITAFLQIIFNSFWRILFSHNCLEYFDRVNKYIDHCVVHKKHEFLYPSRPQFSVEYSINCKLIFINICWWIIRK